MDIDERKDAQQALVVVRVVDEAELHAVQTLGVVVETDRNPVLVAFDPVVSGHRDTAQIPCPCPDCRDGESLDPVPLNVDPADGDALEAAIPTTARPPMAIPAMSPNDREASGSNTAYSFVDDNREPTHAQAVHRAVGHHSQAARRDSVPRPETLMPSMPPSRHSIRARIS